MYVSRRPNTNQVKWSQCISSFLLGGVITLLPLITDVELFEVEHGQLGQVALEPADYCCIFSLMGNLNVGIKPSQMIGVLVTQVSHKETAL